MIAVPAPPPAAMASWMVVVAFWTSVILALIKLGEVVFNLTRSPRLDARLTEDVYFRLNQLGECLFCNAVMLGWNGPSLVADCRIILKKTDNVMKTFPFKVLGVGEKVKGTGTLPDHYFPGTSALRYIPASMPERVLYLSVQREYQDSSREAATKFQNEVLEYKQSVLDQAADRPIAEQPNLRQDALRKINEIVDRNISQVMELVQLEPGLYILSLEVDYTNPKARFRRGRMKTARSSITFAVDGGVKNFFRLQFRQAMLVAATNLLTDQQSPLVWPDYYPTRVSVSKNG